MTLISVVISILTIKLQFLGARLLFPLLRSALTRMKNKCSVILHKTHNLGCFFFVQNYPKFGLYCPNVRDNNKIRYRSRYVRYLFITLRINANKNFLSQKL